MSKIEKALKKIEEGKNYYFKKFAGGERFWCKLMKKAASPEDPSIIQVQEYKPEDPWDVPTGRVLNVSLSNLYYHWLDEISIL